MTRHFGEQIRPASFATRARGRSQRECLDVATHDHDRRRGIQAARKCVAMDGLAIIAMTDVLQDRLAGELYFDGGTLARDCRGHFASLYPAEWVICYTKIRDIRSVSWPHPQPSSQLPI